MNKTTSEAINNRRSNYALKATTPMKDEQLEKLIEDAVKHVPTAFHSQSSRVVILYGAQHELLWELTKETLRPIVPADSFASTVEKVNGFKAGYATILYFDDTEITNGLAQTYTLYKDNFEPWAQQSNGMLQFAIWTLLDEAGFGVNLQHYNPLIDEAVKKNFDIPETWKLIAQMPFGEKAGEPDMKEYVDVKQRFLKRR